MCCDFWVFEYSYTLLIAPPILQSMVDNLHIDHLQDGIGAQKERWKENITLTTSFLDEDSFMMMVNDLHIDHCMVLENRERHE